MLLYLFQGAIDDLTRAITMDPMLNYAYVNRAICFRSVKRYSEAIDDLTVAIGITAYSNSYVNRGITKMLQAQYQQHHGKVPNLN